jgi:hypothetical protein
METKDFILVTLAILGWLWGVIQFIINRNNQKRDRLIDRKYEAYAAYMKKVDEVMNNVRQNPNMVYGIPTDFMKVALTGDSEKINEALIGFNEKLLDNVKKSTIPLMIIKQELNALLIICSNELRIKIKELIALTIDYNNEVQKCLSIISPNDSNSMIRELKTLTHTDRWLRFQTLNDEILEKMREEIESK